MADIVLPLKVKTGLNANLPAAFLSGEMGFTTDSQELWMGTGASRVKVGSVAIAAGAAFSAADKTKLDALPAFVAADEAKLDAITNTGSGAIITAAERANVTANTAAIAALATTYQARSEKGAANGYASLDAGSKVPSAQLPAVALTEPKVYATIAARDADNANVQAGDVAIVTADSKSYMRDSAGTAWLELLSPGLSGVTFNGRAGPTLAPANGDYNAGQITVTPAGNLAATTGAAAFTELQGDIDALNARTAGLALTDAAAIAANTAARHTHTNKAVLDGIPAVDGAASTYLRRNAGGTAYEFGALPASAATWLAMTDTPAAYVASTLNGINAGGTAVVSYDGISGGTF